MVSDTEWAWLAGLVDGEGCLSYGKKIDQKGHVGYSPYLYLGMYSHEAIEKAASILGKFVRAYPNYNKRTWVVKVYGPDLAEVLLHIRPYLTTKAFEADLLAEAIANCPSAKSRGTKQNGHRHLTDEEMALREGYYLVLREAKKQAA